VNDKTHTGRDGKTFCGAPPTDLGGYPPTCEQCARHQAALSQAEDALRRAKLHVRDYPGGPMGVLLAYGHLKQAVDYLERLTLDVSDGSSWPPLLRETLQGEGNMKTAYLVGLLEPDGIGVRLTSIDVFSEPDPGNMGRKRKTVVIAEAWAEDFEAAVQHVLKILDVHPWLKPLLSERASRWLL